MVIPLLTENAQRAAKSKGTELDSGAEDEEQPVDEENIGREVVLLVLDHGQPKGQDQGHDLDNGGEELKTNMMKEAVLTVVAVVHQGSN